MTVAEAKFEFGSDIDTLCKNLCNICTANDWYCTDYCRAMLWIRSHPEKAYAKLAEYDGDCLRLLKGASTWK